MKKHITRDRYFCKCERCGHEWISRKGIPQVCPNTVCHSVRWDKPRGAKQGRPKKKLR